MKHPATACCVPLLAAVFCSCMSEPRMPAMDGAVVEVRRSGVSLAPGDPGYADTLQLFWFGSGCHLIRLGHLSVMTDPFVTNGTRITNARTDPQRVAATFAKLSPPDAIVINHSHIDHLLDAYAALTLPAWRDARVPLHGGRSSRNLLAGWNDDEVLARHHHHGRQGQGEKRHCHPLGGMPVNVAAEKTPRDASASRGVAHGNNRERFC